MSLNLFRCSSCNQILQHDLTGVNTITCPKCGIIALVPSSLALDTAEPAPSPASQQHPVDQETVTWQSKLEPASMGDTLSPPPEIPDLSSATYDFLAPKQAPDEIGRLGSYRVLKILGQGGMGIVFLAEDPYLERKVALKAMKPTLAASDLAKKRFIREAKLTANIKHDRIVTIYQVAEDRGVPFLAMEYLEGESLEDYLGREGTCSIPETIRIGKEIAAGLAEAHQQGLIHRDIKPANIWLEGKNRRVKILDFGLARAADQYDQLTQSGVIVGTPAYMSPEQARSETIDHHSDFFSLGCVLYRLCTGERPFRGKDTIGTLLAVANETPKSPCELNPSIPPSLSQFVMKLLEKGASDRPLSANHIIARLTEIEGCSTNNTHSFNATEPPQNGPVFPGKIRAIQSKWLWLLGGTLGGTLAVIAIFWCTHWLFNLYEKDNTASLNHQEQAPQPQNMTNKLKMRFVWIPPGSFMMGSMPDELGRLPDEAPHKVTLTKGFYMGVHLVTRGQFAAFVEETKFITEAERAGEAGVLTRDGWISGPGANWRNPSFEQTDDHPVTCVSWNDAFAFANWLFKEEGKPYRLPTEAEWEYACRAGTTTAFHFGDSISTDLANYRGRTYRQKTTPVGMFPANAFGLHDMHGNLWEWCHDWFVDYQEGCVIDPKGAGFGIERVHRGGAWMSEAAFCRAACRRGNKPDHKACDIGIRLCLSLK